MFGAGWNSRLVQIVAIVAVGVTAAAAAAADTPPGLSLLYQSDAAYDTATARRLASANPHDLLFRVMGPQTPNSMRPSDIVSFVEGLDNWSGKLWFSADATKSAFDSGYWGNTYGSGDAYKAYVDYLVTVNAALAASNHRPFDGIFLECEGSYLAKSGTTLGRTGLVGTYLAANNSSATLIGTTGSWKQATTAPGLGLDIDLLAIQAYNFDNGDPPGFTTPSTASATSLAVAISGTLAGNYVADLTALTTPGVVVMFSYEPQFFGATGSGGALWDAPLFESFLTSLRGDLSTLGVSGTATLGVYDVGAAIGAWDAASLAVPEPSGWALAALGLACAAVWRGRGHRRWSLLPALFSCLMPACVSADDAKPFAYFIDTLNDANISATPANCAVIGEIGPGTNAGQRGHYTTSGRVVGVSAAFYAENNLWTHSVPANGTNGTPAYPSLQTLFSGTVDLGTQSSRTAFAQQIIASTLQYPLELPSASEAQHTSAGGYVLWSQDLEMATGGDTPEQMAAAITAILWAGRQIAGGDLLIVPVPSSSVQKTTAADWQLADVLTSPALLGQLNLADTLAQPGDRDHLASMDLLSMLRLVHNIDTSAPLLDGFLAQQYQAGLIGTFPADEVTFYDKTLPYAIMSAHDNPSQLPATPPTEPFTTYYSGAMPFQAGVYWYQASIDGAFDPAAYLRPEARGLAMIVPEPAAATLLTGGLFLLALLAALHAIHRFCRRCWPTAVILSQSIEVLSARPVKRFFFRMSAPHVHRLLASSGLFLQPHPARYTIFNPVRHLTGTISGSDSPV